MNEDQQNIELNADLLGGVASGGKDDDGGKGGVICPQCKVENHPAHTTIREERRFTCWRCGYTRELTDEEVNRILRGQGLSW